MDSPFTSVAVQPQPRTEDNINASLDAKIQEIQAQLRKLERRD